MPSADEESNVVKSSGCTDLDAARKPLARLRCLKNSVDSLTKNEPLPPTLCYVPAEVTYEVTRNDSIIVYATTAKDRRKLSEISCSTAHRVVVSGEELYTSEGHWARLLRVLKGDEDVDTVEKNQDRWIVLFTRDPTVSDLFTLVPDAGFSGDKGEKNPQLNRWEDVVEHEYGLRLAKLCQPAPADQRAVDQMRQNPTGWSLAHYEQLAQLLSVVAAESGESLSNVGDVKQYIESLSVSSQSDDDVDSTGNLTDGNPATYWETDGGVGSHWIKVTMKPGTIIRKLVLVINMSDENYVPRRIIVMGGSPGNLRKLNDVNVDHNEDGIQDVVVLSDRTEHLPFIEIRIKECQDGGIDARVHGIKIVSLKEKEMGLNRDVLENKDMLMRYPKLEEFTTDIIYQKAMVLQRFMKLVDSVLPLLVPRWEYSQASFTSLEVLRELLPLSRKRCQLLDQFLRESESSVPGSARKVYIDRRAAMEHRSDPSVDLDCRNAVFSQLFDGLKPRDDGQKPLDYRWPSRYHQWWECKFVGEGIIDQGGGFRDSLSDVAEELCPSSSDTPVPLPFFIRSPNQTNVDASSCHDLYIPNPSCTQFHKYEWIGKLMGVCFRGRENLVLSLPSFVWKTLCGQSLSWTKDFMSVDEAQVKLLESMKTMDEDAFKAYFGDELMWTAMLSNGSVVHLKPGHADGSTSHVHFADRLSYIDLVKQARMNESRQQIEAIRNGLTQVVPQAAFELFTWQEVEKRICGETEITIAALRQNIMLEEMRKEDQRVKLLWEVLEKFSNEDRSRFLRFVTGRRRLPAVMHVVGDDGKDSLPTASTCGSVLMLPTYSSAQMMEEKLRYAVYNCIAIDTDTGPTRSYDD